MLTTMQQDPQRVEIIVMSCCVLHNLLQTRYPHQAAHLLDREHPNNHNVIPGAWRDDDVLLGLHAIGRNTSSKAGKLQRKYMCDYYSSPIGKLPWQDDMIWVGEYKDI